ncbi:glutaryl-CoA dehydrogenase [Thermotomaculum hydrothermale]|uniref:Glutaryl-CoA dehydrogenase n=1 Tax=Thermotomaculum hydrothermale TaxID=981385 RepID=A0A7R6PG79_9BACT|nr:acyl-CoA dehydrogenase family protein [Thermotomaculum hydrothermale]BBB33169.1 glutaryl-CoA dehydrogenase [Thermotomaculum hydrothermale]
MRNYPDFLKIEDLLTEEERLVYDTVHDFVSNEVKPIIADYFERGEFPIHLVKQLGELGFLGSTLSEYGGAGLSNVAYGLINQELERGDSGLRSFVSVQSSLVIYPIYEFGSEEQKKKYLPGLIDGNLIGCFGLTEPDFGSNPGGMKTYAVKKGDKWILNGTKMWITNASIADIAVVWAKTEEGIQGFIVEKDMPGFSAPEIKHKLSLRASVTGELIFEDVEVPEGNRLPLAKGLKYPLMCLTQARYGIGWGALGAAIDCYLTAVDYAKTRIQFDVPIARFQLVQKKLADMLTEITKAQLLALQVGRLKDSGKYSHYMISMLKMNNVRMALDIARTARDILGANGISLEYPVIRHMVNLESVKTYEGTEDIHTLILGQYITGFQAFSLLK